MIETLPEQVTYGEDTANETTRETEKETDAPTVVAVPETSSPIRVNAADSSTRVSFSGLDYSQLENVWELTINGATYKVLFPKTEDLVIVDGVLVNIGTSNITGVVLGNTLDLSTYFQRTYTVLPLSGSGAQTNAYRYGGHSYLTVYSPGTGQTLASTQTYGDAMVVHSGKFGATWNSVNVVIIALLALQVLISFIGGIIRRG